MNDLSIVSLLLAALAVAPNLIRVYRELRAQERQGGQHNSSALLASCPPVPFNFPPMSLQVLSTDNRGPRSGKGRAAQLAASQLLKAYPAPVPFNYPQMLSRRAPDKK